MMNAHNQTSTPPGSSPFGQLLRHWRGARKRSQLDLALDASVSQRHLSCLESGRAQPSRQMVLLLAEVLGVPLRDRNLLMHAAGFAPVFQQHALETDEMSAVRDLLAEVGQFPGVPPDWQRQPWLQVGPLPIFPLEFDVGTETLKVCSMLSSLGTAVDITAQELRVETFFPADDFSRDFFRRLSL